MSASKSRKYNVVVGGGLAGLSLLYRLHRSGFENLLLIEKDALVSGESGKSAGIVLHDEEGLRSLAIYRELDVEVKDYGPFSYVNPYEFAIKIYYGLRSDGVQFELFEEVVDLEAFEGHVMRVITGRSSYPVEKLFVAANLGIPSILERLGKPLPDRYYRIQEIIFRSPEPIEPVAIADEDFFVRTEGTHRLIVLGRPEVVNEAREGLTRAEPEFVDRVVEFLIGMGFEDIGLEKSLIGYEAAYPCNRRDGSNVYIFACFDGMGSTYAPARAWRMEI